MVLSSYAARFPLYDPKAVTEQLVLSGYVARFPQYDPKQ